MSWEIGAVHGGNEVWSPLADGYVEPRVEGVTSLRVSFDSEMDTSMTDPANVSIVGVNNGPQPAACTISWSGSTLMIIDLCTALPDEDTYTVTLGAGVVSAGGCPLAGDVSLCLVALAGDANANCAANAQDLLAVRAQIGETVGPANAKYDVNCNGTINAQDLLAVRACVGHSAPTCP